MNIKLKWFIHEHYFEIATGILPIVIILVWRSWVAGMKIYHDDKHIQKLWADELSSQSYYGLDINKEIKQLF